jgi:signal transduction histidine kinase
MKKFKFNLKIKLTLSYLFLSLFLVGSFFLVSNSVLVSKFQNYIINQQEKKNQDIVNQVTSQFGGNGEIPDMETLLNVGNTALSNGIVLMVNDTKGNELFCMSTYNQVICDNMIESMQTQMTSVYPNFRGEYEQKDYTIVKGNTQVASVTLGYYGPFYYNDQDIQFLSVLNKVLVWISVFFFFVAACLGFFMANRIAMPIKEVIDQTKQIELGNYSNRILLGSRTEEIKQLIHSVNTLAETLERQQVSKKRLVRNYAHELRTPLAALQSNLEAMIDGIWEPTTNRLEGCRTEILRLTSMIADIDKLVKIESDSFVLNKTQVNLKELVSKIISNFEQDMVAKDLSLETDMDSVWIWADRDKLIQVVINLLANAIRYTDQGGRIQLSVKKDKNRAKLVVKDTGIGISEEDITSIFDYLYRTDESRNRDTGGCGIGLSIVKAIVDAHGGSIEVSSKLSQGSEFKVELPIE